MIITSATLDTEKFSEAFGHAPVVNVEGRTYPVEVEYLPIDPDLEDEGEITYVDMAVRAIDGLGRSVCAPTVRSATSRAPSRAPVTSPTIRPAARAIRTRCEGKSKDKTTQNYWGAKLSGSYRISQLGGATPWLTIAGNYLDTRFDTKAQTFGFRDRSSLKSDTGTVTFGLGVPYPITEKIDVSIGGSFTPLWVVRPPSTIEEQDGLLNARTTLLYRFF